METVIECVRALRECLDFVWVQRKVQSGKFNPELSRFHSAAGATTSHVETKESGAGKHPGGAGEGLCPEAHVGSHHHREAQHQQAVAVVDTLPAVLSQGGCEQDL